jgi:hypothetical protein
MEPRMTPFITNMYEFRAAQEQVVDYVVSERHDDNERIEQLVTEMELFVLREDLNHLSSKDLH